MSESKTAQGHGRGALSIARTITRVVIIVALAGSGVRHLLQPYYYLQTVAAYDLIPSWMLFASSFAFPSLQIALGFGMLSNYIGKIGVYCALVLFAVFLIAQASVLWRGKSIDCGCFGFQSSQVSLTSAIIPSSLAACCIFLLLTNRHEPGVADRTFPESMQNPR